MHNCIYVVVVVLLVNLRLVMGQTEEYEDLVWSDEFDGASLDATKWQTEVDCNGGGNNELQCYTARSKNVFIDDGALVLKAYKETDALILRVLPLGVSDLRSAKQERSCEEEWRLEPS